MTSEQAAHAKPDNTLHFCFIDADYRYEAVNQNIELWLPKVKSRGIICGHDYVKDGNIYNKADGSLIGLFGVQGAVKEFAAHDGWNVHVTESKERSYWFAFKPWFLTPLGLAILPVAGEHSPRLVPRLWRR